MKAGTYSLCAVVVLVLLSLLIGRAQDTSKAEADKSRVLMLEKAWNQAEQSNDAHALDGLLARSFAYTDSDGEFMNKEQFLKSIITTNYHPDQIVNESMNAWAHDRAVIVTGTYREKGTQKGKPYAHRGRFTDTWVEENGSWFCAASQETLMKETAK